MDEIHELKKRVAELERLVKEHCHPYGGDHFLNNRMTRWACPQGGGNCDWCDQRSTCPVFKE